MNIARLSGIVLVILSLPSRAATQTTGASPVENLSVFVGVDGSKQPQDLGINAQAGLRIGANWGASLMPTQGVGVQAGAGLNVSDAALLVFDQLGGPSSRQQVFLTLGVFQRTDRGVEWAVAYDNLYQRYYDTNNLAQMRAQVGYDLRPSDQVGLAWRVGLRGDDADVLETPVRLDPIAQLDVFHRHTWANGVRTTVWVGGAGGHDTIVFGTPGETIDQRAFVYGASLLVPLSDRFSLVGASNLIMPAGAGTVDAFLGLSWFPGRNAMRASSNRFSPMLPVANNPEFAVNARR